MADLHPLELLSALGALVTAVLTLVAPESRMRLVAAWSLIGIAVASAVVARPGEAMFGVYGAAVLLALGSWAVSRRVAAAPVRSVWREGRGSGSEHVTRPGDTWRWAGRVLVLALTVASVAIALGLLPVPWQTTVNGLR